VTAEPTPTDTETDTEQAANRADETDPTDRTDPAGPEGAVRSEGPVGTGGAGAAAGAAVQPRVDTPRDRYRRAVAALAAPLRDRLVALDLADRDLAAGRRAAAAKVEQAAHRVRDAEDQAEAARRAHHQSEREAGRLWREIRAFHGRRGARLEELPEPERVGSAHPGSAMAWLSRAERTLHQAKRGELRIEPPVPIPPVMVAAGLVAAVVLGIVGTVLLHVAAGIHTDAGPAVRVVAIICFLASPFAGIPVGAAWLSRYGQPIVGRPLLWVLGAGLVAGCALSAWAVL
jgi:hypothetical protein